MRKLFSFCAAMLVALAANATVKNIEPGTDKLTDALSSAADGDVIILADGTYNEAGDYIVFNKNVEVKAAENAKPQIDVVNYIKVSGGKTVKIQGLKFNGEAQGKRDQYIRIYTGENNLEVVDCEFDAIKKNIFRCEADNKFASLKVKNCKFNNSVNSVIDLESSTCGDIEFDGCEFTWGTAVPIHFEKTSHADKLSINNCYFHDGKRSAVFFEAPSPAAALCDSVFVTNSTFAKIANTNDYWVSIIDIRNGGSQKKLGYVLVDHCTFYDCTTINTDHVAVRVHKSIDATVSNCIFWDPNQDTQDADSKRAATNLYGGDVKNCIAYNYFYGTEGHIHNGATYTACSQADPLFVDAANGNFMLAAGSPAIGAATDGSNLGDPFWNAKTLYLNPGVWNAEGAKFAIFTFGSGSHGAQWSGFMTEVDGSGIFTTDIPAGFPKIIYGRINGELDEPDWGDGKCWNQSYDLDVPPSKDQYAITAWGGDKSPGEWSKHNAKFYIAGSMTNWSDFEMIGSTEDSYTLKLDAGNHQLKVVDNGGWLGASDLTGLKDGLWPDEDGNVCFTLAAAGDVIVNYKSGEVFTVTGDFVNPEVKIIGSFDGEWTSETTPKALVEDAGGETASITLNLSNTYYEFKIIRAGDLLSLNGEGESLYELKNNWTSVSGLKRNQRNFKLTMTSEDKVPGDYKFTWEYATGTLTVTFPDKGGETALDNTELNAKVGKTIENGMLIIEKNGVRYNAQGQIVR